VRAASDWRDALSAASPYFIDGIDNAAMDAFVSWPERLFVIRDGVLEYVGGFGPERYDVAELEAWLESHVSPCTGSGDGGGGFPRVKELVADVVNNKKAA
jgi:hypothetical protein